MKKKRTRDRRVIVMLSSTEQQQLQERMAEVGMINMSAFIRKIILNGYVLHVDISPLSELISLQRRCINNLNQISKHIKTDEIATLQKDYDALWEHLAELLKLFAEVIKL